MKTWKKALLAIGVGSGVLIGPALADDAKIQLMFVQTSAGIAADPAAGTLRLINVSPQTLYFSDRPVRVAGHLTMDGYLEEWKTGKDNFGEDPPNATLSIFQPGQETNTLVVVELLDPQVEGNDLVYHYKLIEGEMPEGDGMAALFIDWIGPGGGVGAGFRGVGVGRRGPGVAGWAGVAVHSD
ncbi:hypothetical protein [Stappia indica]|uniref:hypothetical protein n=1 Tax=Stappia indica TaxID=538381 RepID=UPI001CD409E2|nr:hypothetical protein [Stappia indica]MCA1300571.1 hypothetical protein [Stappia indica]